MTWDTDKQFTEHRLTKVEAYKNGWSLLCDDSFCIHCPGDECAQAPAVGEAMRLYGKGLGYPVRGIIIEGRVYRYHTVEQEEEKHREWVEARHREKTDELERERTDRDYRRSRLPEAFRERLNVFETRNPNWRRDNEPYELMVCEDAARIAAHFESDIEALEAFADKRWEEQKTIVAGLGDGHSGNSWSCAVHLAGRFMRDPSSVLRAHGALCPLVGCVEYGCPFAETRGARVP